MFSDASGLLCVLLWGGFSSPGAGGLFRGCHVAARPCPCVSVETPPPYVGFGSRSPSVQLSIPRKGERRRNDEGSAQRPKPKGRDPSEKEKRGRKNGALQNGGGRAPEERVGRRGAENSHPHQEMVVVRGQEGPSSSIHYDVEAADAVAEPPARLPAPIVVVSEMGTLLARVAVSAGRRLRYVGFTFI